MSLCQTHWLQTYEFFSYLNEFSLPKVILCRVRLGKLNMWYLQQPVGQSELFAFWGKKRVKKKIVAVAHENSALWAVFLRMFLADFIKEGDWLSKTTEVPP